MPIARCAILTDILLVFKVHQPFRIKKGFFWERKMFRRVRKAELSDFYFDDDKNREIFERASRKCYFPANEILLRLIDEYKHEKKRVKVAFSISGVFLEQCEKYDQDVLESFKQLSRSECVEMLDQPYYHSLTGLYPQRDEFFEQVKMHKQLVKDLFGLETATIENTELMYNNAIAKAVDKLGYTGIFTEGVDRILKGRSPNYVYRAKNCKNLKVLLRNFKLTDDIGFRFSLRSWSDWPLTADKFALWLKETEGQCITIFPDYETFGEHHWPETGIHEFLKHLPQEILKWQTLELSTPSEVLKKHAPVGEIDVPELGQTVSWADVQRDTSGWLGNTMQWAYYTTTKELEPLVKEVADPEFMRLWRNFLTSDHLYYMFTAGGAPGEVHTYFSPYDSAVDAFVTAQGAIFDYETRLRQSADVANEPFVFYKVPGDENSVGIKVWSLSGLAQALAGIEKTVIEFHNRRGDFQTWAEFSLKDEKLAKKFEQVHESGLTGERLRKELSDIAKKRIAEVRALGEEASHWF